MTRHSVEAAVRVGSQKDWLLHLDITESSRETVGPVGPKQERFWHSLRSFFSGAGGLFLFMPMACMDQGIGRSLEVIGLPKKMFGMHHYTHNTHTLRYIAQMNEHKFNSNWLAVALALNNLVTKPLTCKNGN